MSEAHSICSATSSHTQLVDSNLLNGHFNSASKSDFEEKDEAEKDGTDDSVQLLSLDADSATITITTAADTASLAAAAAVNLSAPVDKQLVKRMDPHGDSVRDMRASWRRGILTIVSDRFAFTATMSLTSGVSLQVDGPITLLVSLFQALVRVSINYFIATRAFNYDEAKIVEGLKNDMKSVQEKLDTLLSIPLKAAILHLKKAAICFEHGGEVAELEAQLASRQAESESVKAMAAYENDAENLVQAYYVNIISSYWNLVNQKTKKNLPLFYHIVIKPRLFELFRHGKILSAIRSQAVGGSWFGNREARCKLIRSLVLLCQCIEQCFILPPAEAVDANALQEHNKLLQELREKDFAIQFGEKEKVSNVVDGRYMNWALKPNPSPVLELNAHTVLVLADFLVSTSGTSIAVHQVSRAKLLDTVKTGVSQLLKVSDTHCVTVWRDVVTIWIVGEFGIKAVQIIDNVPSARDHVTVQRLTDDHLLFKLSDHHYEIYQISTATRVVAPFLNDFRLRLDEFLLKVLSPQNNQNTDGVVLFQIGKPNADVSNWLLWRSATNEQILPSHSPHEQNDAHSLTDSAALPLFTKLEATDDCILNNLLIDLHSNWLFSVSQCKYLRPLGLPAGAGKNGLTKLSEDEVICYWHDAFAAKEYFEVWRVTAENDQLVSKFSVASGENSRIGVARMHMTGSDDDRHVAITQKSTKLVWIYNYRSGKQLSTFSTSGLCDTTVFYPSKLDTTFMLGMSVGGKAQVFTA